jgi:hypothetical protein
VRLEGLGQLRKQMNLYYDQYIPIIVLLLSSSCSECLSTGNTLKRNVCCFSNWTNLVANCPLAGGEIFPQPCTQDSCIIVGCVLLDYR